MTTITIDRAVLEQALNFVTSERWGTVPYMDDTVFFHAHELAVVLREALNAPSNIAPLSNDDGQAPKVDAEPLSDEQWAKLAWMHPADRTCVTTDSRAVLEAALKERNT